MSLHPIWALALLHSVCSRGYKRAREGTAPKSLVACASVCVCERERRFIPLSGIPLFPFIVLGKEGVWYKNEVRNKRRKPWGSDVIQPTLPQQSIMAGPAVLADANGDHSSPISRPVAIVADGKWHGTLWMTPRWWCCCSQDMVVRSRPPSERPSCHWRWLPVEVEVPWAFRNAKAFQGIDQEAGEARCSLSIALDPSFLSHLKTKIGWTNFAQVFGYKGNIWYLLLQHGGVQFPWIHDY